MTRDQFNAFCATLPKSTHVVQWGGSDVWKIGGKVFAIAGLDRGNKTGGKVPGITFKVSPVAFQVLKEQEGLRPAPYLASRGLSWIQHYAAPGLSDDELKAHIAASYRLVGEGLTRKARGGAGPALGGRGPGLH